MNKSSRLITLQEYDEILNTIAFGNSFARPNERVALVIRIVAETGCKLVEALAITRDVCFRNKDRYTIHINNSSYCLSYTSSRLLDRVISTHNIGRDDLVFNISTRAVQRCLATACSYLGFVDICIKSFARLYQARCESEIIYSKEEHARIMAELHSTRAVPMSYSASDVLSGIYCIRCRPNGMVYIGESCDIIKRWHDHLYSLKCNAHLNDKIQSDYIKYGAGAFDFNVLLLCDDEAERKQIESLYISAMGTIQFGYNIKP